VSHPSLPFETQDKNDDDGAVIDSFLVETDSPPDIREAIKELTTGLQEALKTPVPPGRLLTGTMTFLGGANAFLTPTMILPADPRRKSLTISLTSLAPTSGKLTQLISTGTAVTGPTTLRSVIGTSSDGATSGAGKVEVRDSTNGTGPVLLTLSWTAGGTANWSSDGSGIPITNGVHLTISGTGPGNFAMVETESGDAPTYLSIADENGKCLSSGAMNLRPGGATPLSLGDYTGALWAQIPAGASASGIEVTWAAVTR
jgi:hypothetical protein